MNTQITETNSDKVNNKKNTNETGLPDDFHENMTNLLQNMSF
jgi:hypothetical protein